MRKNLTVFFGLMLSLILLLSACSDDEDVKADDEEDVVEVDEKDDEEEPKEEEDEDEEPADVATGDVDFSEMIKYMEDETEGSAKVLHENQTAQEFDEDGVTVSLDAYTLVELTDFHTNFQIPFNDETDGGVIVAHYSVTNSTDEDISFMPSFYMTYTGAHKDYNNYRDLLPLEEQLATKLGPSTDYLLEAGETISGYYTYPFGQEYLDEVLKVGSTEVDLPQAQTDPEDFGSRFGPTGKFKFSLTDEGAETVAEQGAFYEDRATYENMGEKKMIKEEVDINESEKLGDIKVTLDGYQFAEFTPNEVEAPRFSNFKNGIVLLTVNFKLDNGAKKNIGLTSTTSKLTVNDGGQWLLSEGMLTTYNNNDIIEPGDSGEILQVYVLDKEQYDKIWKDKAFEVEIGPVKSDEVDDLTKGKRATFELP